MDFFAMKRRQLQELCKQHKIRANMKNVEMAQALTLLLHKKNEESVSDVEPAEAQLGLTEMAIDSVTSPKAKKVKFSPDNETFYFVATDKDSDSDCDYGPKKKRGGRGRRKSVGKKEVGGAVRNVREVEVVEIKGTPVCVTRSRKQNMDAEGIESVEGQKDCKAIVLHKGKEVAREDGRKRRRGDKSEGASQVVVPRLEAAADNEKLALRRSRRKTTLYSSVAGAGKVLAICEKAVETEKLAVEPVTRKSSDVAKPGRKSKMNACKKVPSETSDDVIATAVGMDGVVKENQEPSLLEESSMVVYEAVDRSPVLHMVKELDRDIAKKRTRNKDCGANSEDDQSSENVLPPKGCVRRSNSKTAVLTELRMPAEFNLLLEEPKIDVGLEVTEPVGNENGADSCFSKEAVEKSKKKRKGSSKKVESATEVGLVNLVETTVNSNFEKSMETSAYLNDNQFMESMNYQGKSMFNEEQDAVQPVSFTASIVDLNFDQSMDTAAHLYKNQLVESLNFQGISMDHEEQNVVQPISSAVSTVDSHLEKSMDASAHLNEIQLVESVNFQGTSMDHEEHAAVQPVVNDMESVAVLASPDKFSNVVVSSNFTSVRDVQSSTYRPKCEVGDEVQADGALSGGININHIETNFDDQVAEVKAPETTDVIENSGAKYGNESSFGERTKDVPAVNEGPDKSSILDKCPLRDIHSTYGQVAKDEFLNEDFINASDESKGSCVALDSFQMSSTVAEEGREGIGIGSKLDDNVLPDLPNSDGQVADENKVGTLYGVLVNKTESKDNVTYPENNITGECLIEGDLYCSNGGNKKSKEKEIVDEDLDFQEDEENKERAFEVGETVDAIQKGFSEQDVGENTDEHMEGNHSESAMHASEGKETFKNHHAELSMLQDNKISKEHFIASAMVQECIYGMHDRNKPLEVQNSNVAIFEERFSETVTNQREVVDYSESQDTMNFERSDNCKQTFLELEKCASAVLCDSTSRNDKTAPKILKGKDPEGMNQLLLDGYTASTDDLAWCAVGNEVQADCALAGGIHINHIETNFDGQVAEVKVPEIADVIEDSGEKDWNESTYGERTKDVPAVNDEKSSNLNESPLRDLHNTDGQVVGDEFLNEDFINASDGTKGQCEALDSSQLLPTVAEESDERVENGFNLDDSVLPDLPNTDGQVADGNNIGTVYGGMVNKMGSKADMENYIMYPENNTIGYCLIEGDLYCSNGGNKKAKEKEIVDEDLAFQEDEENKDIGELVDAIQKGFAEQDVGENTDEHMEVNYCENAMDASELSVLEDNKTFEDHHAELSVLEDNKISKEKYIASAMVQECIYDAHDSNKPLEVQNSNVAIFEERFSETVTNQREVVDYSVSQETGDTENYVMFPENNDTRDCLIEGDLHYSKGGNQKSKEKESVDEDLAFQEDEKNKVGETVEAILKGYQDVGENTDEHVEVNHSENAMDAAEEKETFEDHQAALSMLEDNKISKEHFIASAMVQECIYGMHDRNKPLEVQNSNVAIFEERFSETVTNQREVVDYSESQDTMTFERSDNCKQTFLELEKCASADSHDSTSRDDKTAPKILKGKDPEGINPPLLVGDSDSKDGSGYVTESRHLSGQEGNGPIFLKPGRVTGLKFEGLNACMNGFADTPVSGPRHGKAEINALENTSSPLGDTKINALGNTASPVGSSFGMNCLFGDEVQISDLEMSNAISSSEDVKEGNGGLAIPQVGAGELSDHKQQAIEEVVKLESTQEMCFHFPSSFPVTESSTSGVQKSDLEVSNIKEGNGVVAIPQVGAGELSEHKHHVIEEVVKLKSPQEMGFPLPPSFAVTEFSTSAKLDSIKRRAIEADLEKSIAVSTTPRQKNRDNLVSRKSFINMSRMKENLNARKSEQVTNFTTVKPQHNRRALEDLQNNKI